MGTNKPTLEGTDFQVSEAVLTGSELSSNNGSIHVGGSAMRGLHQPSAAESGDAKFDETEPFDDDCGSPPIPAGFQKWTKAAQLAWMEEDFARLSCVECSDD